MDSTTIDLYSNPISVIIDAKANSVYEVPMYQREYAWGIKNWEKLFNDLMDNACGYFLGSIICVDSKDSEDMDMTRREVVDGQQRLISISLLLTAIYVTLQKYKKEMDTEQSKDMAQTLNRLLLKGTEATIRVIPQTQHYNQEDYMWVLASNKIIPSQTMPSRAGNRRIVKAYNYFKKRIDDILSKTDDEISKAFEILKKVNTAIMILISVDSYADAFTLFESLNNRGLPLTSVDIIKNFFLKQLEIVNKGHIDYYSSRWSDIIDNLGSGPSEQERFFRQNYNAFRAKFNALVVNNGERQYPLGATATHSNLLDIYQKIIEADPIAALDEVYKNAEIYGSIISQEGDGISKGLHGAFLDLQRVQGAPSYLLVMYLIKKQDALDIKDDDIIKVCQLLVRFFVHRNITNVPPTRDMNRLFMLAVEKIEQNNYQGDNIYLNLRNDLLRETASNEEFREKLSGPVYDDNKNATRFILCMLENRGATRETHKTLWNKTEKDAYELSIEHIFPQGPIKSWWVDMIAAGDEKKAKEYQEQYVHTFGNLTITGYNSKLSNRPFGEKKELKNNKGEKIGFNNGLNLNADVYDKEVWTVEDILNRTKRMVDEIMEIFAL